MTVRTRFARASVREQILQQYAQHNPQVSALGGSDDVHAVHDIDGGREKVRSRLHAIRTENASAWQNLKSALPTRTDFATAASRNDLSRAPGGEVYRAAFGGGAQELTSAYESYAAHYLGELAQGGSFERARARAFESHAGPYWTTGTESQLQAMQQHVDVDGHLIDRAMRENPPTLHADPHTAQQVEAARDVLNSLPPSMRHAQALYGYGDLLPGQLGDETHTAAAKVAESLHPGTAGGGGGGGDHDHRRPRARPEDHHPPGAA
jgi:hypothetical protein